MRKIETGISRVLKSHLFSWAIIVFGSIGLFVGAMSATSTPGDFHGGIFFRNPVGMLHEGFLSSLIVTLLSVGALMLMILINSAFNLLRSGVPLFGAIFILMQCAVCENPLALVSSTVMCIVILTAIFIYYASYMNLRSTPAIYLVMLLLAAGSTWEYAYAVYIPVFMVGCVQMRIFSLKMLLAILLAILTPLWVLWGFGIVDLDQMRFTNPIAIVDYPIADENLRSVMAVIITLFAGLVLGVSNLFTTMGYNAKSRALNGLLTLVSIVTGTLCLVDSGHLIAYAATLNCCVAIQTALFFRINYKRRGYLAVLPLVIIYTLIFVWSIID